METVSFISIEDDPPDLILSFAVWQPELDEIQSLILIRTPEFEVFLQKSEQGVSASYEDWPDNEEEKLEKIEFEDDFVRIITTYNQLELYLGKVGIEEIEEAKSILKRMNFDNCFKMQGM
jgi:hypothetical protein